MLLLPQQRAVQRVDLVCFGFFSTFLLPLTPQIWLSLAQGWQNYPSPPSPLSTGPSSPPAASLPGLEPYQGEGHLQHGCQSQGTVKERDAVDEKRGRPGLVATRSARRPFGHQQPVNGAVRVLGAVQHHFAVSLSGQLHPATADSPDGRHRFTGPAPRPAAKCRQTPSSAVKRCRKKAKAEGRGGGPPVSHQPAG